MLHEWTFVGSPDGTWIWRGPSGKRSHATFASLGAAISHAQLLGFDAKFDYWVSLRSGRAVHYRPGRPAINMPAGEDPGP